MNMLFSILSLDQNVTEFQQSCSRASFLVTDEHHLS